MMKFIVLSLSFAMAQVSLAQTAPSLDLKQVVAKYFPHFDGRFLEVTSTENNCVLRVTSDDKVMSLELIKGHQNGKFSNDVILKKETVLVEEAGRSKAEGFYSYASFFFFENSTTMTKGLFYYTPSLEKVDSSEDILQEQKITLDKTAEGTAVTFTERARVRPQFINCTF